MFGNRKSDTSGRQGASGDPPGRGKGANLSRHDFGFKIDEAAPPRTLATFDRLGQTIVATVTVGALSGPDTGELAGELCGKVFLPRGGVGGVGDGDGGLPEAGEVAGMGGVGGAAGVGGSGARFIVLDLQNVQYMDSMCIGVLVELMSKLKEIGGRIALVNTTQNVEYLFKLTRLDRVFPIFRDVMKAIEQLEREG